MNNEKLINKLLQDLKNHSNMQDDLYLQKCEALRTLYVRESVNKIAEKLRREKILIPSAYAAKKGIKKATVKVPLGEFIWHHRTITEILQNQSYVGDVVNFKTYSKSFKLKKRLENDKENWEIHKNVHDPIIGRADFEKVQTTFGDTKNIVNLNK